jgi:hypothetical protein
VNFLTASYARLKAKANSIILRLTHTKQWMKQPTPKESTSPPRRKPTRTVPSQSKSTASSKGTRTNRNKKLLKQKPRIYKGKAWYLKKGMAPMAVPGSSNHNLGIAIDIANASGKRLEWLAKHAPRYGWSWEFTSGAEPWHIRYVAGDDVPELVKEWKAKQSIKEPAPQTCPTCNRAF